ncbi:GNAT family N-acetyltransferase [Pectobacterium versatile]|uniref:GNAT family N-acetyltransferase n=1 Tax=Pectobacterium versatile TaxID=2488639 RepID=UPI0032EC92A1
MDTQFIIIENGKITDLHRGIFAGMLKAQGKVKGDLNTKADRCKSICFAYYNGELAAVGALKRKTTSVFFAAKADLNTLESEFEWELGYIYTAPKFQGKGLARKVVETLLESFGNENLMASTEISKNPRMVRILESNGFKLHGKSWKSDIHENYLGLFLKFK